MECNYALLIEHKQVCRKSIDILKENIHCVSWIFRIGLVLPFLCVYFCFHGFPKQNLLLNITKDNSSSSFLVLWQMMSKVLFSGEGKSFITAVNQCSKFCRRDRRCIGMELCKITEDRIRCRVCCKTKMEEEGIPSNNTDRCRYMAMVRCDFLLIKHYNLSVEYAL